MADDLDDLLRRTMKTLDDQVPSGYFEALPERVQARLAGDEGTMQQTSGTTNREAASSGGVPPVATRDEDSGLHDIRNLAQSTKQRLSSKRITTSPPASDDDVLATSSASWRNVALPQPASMVSLPAIEDLPSKQEIKAQEKAAKKAAKLETPAPAPVAAVEDPSASQQAAFSPAFSSFAERAKPSHRGRNLALAGMGLAAAAGIGIFVMTQKNGASDKAAPAVASAPASETRGISDKTKELDEATAKLQAQRAAAAEQAAKDEAAAAAAGAANSAPAPEETQEPKVAAPVSKGAPAKHATKTKADTAKAVKIEDTAKPVETKPEAKDGKKAKPEPGDPSFDELLKEAGVDQKKNDKPKLEKKQLSGDDFKKGMAAIQSKAQACFKGTQGTAAVKLTIAPSGQVSKVTVGGVFAGKPEADCVTAAVKSAQFPAWDGGPQSFGYPILLSE